MEGCGGWGGGKNAPGNSHTLIDVDHDATGPRCTKSRFRGRPSPERIELCDLSQSPRQDWIQTLWKSPQETVNLYNNQYNGFFKRSITISTFFLENPIVLVIVQVGVFPEKNNTFMTCKAAFKTTGACAWRRRLLHTKPHDCLRPKKGQTQANLIFLGSWCTLFPTEMCILMTCRAAFQTIGACAWGRCVGRCTTSDGR